MWTGNSPTWPKETPSTFVQGYFLNMTNQSGGIGYGMINQISTKGIMLWFSSRLRATAMGIKQTGVILGAG